MNSKVLEFIKSRKEKFEKIIEYKVNDDFILKFNALGFNGKCKASNVFDKFYYYDTTKEEMMPHKDKDLVDISNSIIDILIEQISPKCTFSDLSVIAELGFSNHRAFFECIFEPEQLYTILSTLRNNDTENEEKK